MRRALTLLLVLPLLASACSRGEAGRRADASPTARPRPLTAVARSSADVDPVFHVGQQIFITDDGFKPKQLVAVVAEKISWINETDSPKEIRFVNGGFESGPIEPDETAEFTPPSAASVVYELVDEPKVTGAIQVEPYFDPGEDPAAEDRFDADSPAPTHRR